MRNFSLETHDLKEVIAKKELVRLNNLAIKRGYRRSLKSEMLDRLPDTFAPTGNPIRFNCEVDYTAPDVDHDCERLLIYLPLDPSKMDGFVPAWVDAKIGQKRLTSIWVPKSFEQMEVYERHDAQNI